MRHVSVDQTAYNSLVVLSDWHNDTPISLSFTFIHRLMFLLPPLEALAVFLFFGGFLLPVLKTDCHIRSVSSPSFSESSLLFERFCWSTSATLRMHCQYVKILVLPIKQITCTKEVWSFIRSARVSVTIENKDGNVVQR